MLYFHYSLKIKYLQSLSQTCKLGINVIILYISKMRWREVTQCAQDHIAFFEEHCHISCFPSPGQFSSKNMLASGVTLISILQLNKLFLNVLLWILSTYTKFERILEWTSYFYGLDSIINIFALLNIDLSNHKTILLFDLFQSELQKLVPLTPKHFSMHIINKSSILAYSLF